MDFRPDPGADIAGILRALQMQDVCTLLHNLGFSFQKARFVSDHLDTANASPGCTEVAND